MAVTRKLKKRVRRLQAATRKAVRRARPFLRKIVAGQFQMGAEWITFRMAAAMDTTLGAYVISGKIGSTLFVVIGEVFTKYPINMVNEYLWKTTTWGTHPARDGTGSRCETHLRSFLRAASYRVLGTADTAFLSFLATGDIGMVWKIAAWDAVSKVIIRYLNSRAWHGKNGPFRKWFARRTARKLAVTP